MILLWRSLLRQERDWSLSHRRLAEPQSVIGTACA